MTLGEIRSDVKTLLSQQAANDQRLDRHIQEDKRRDEKTEARISGLEKFRVKAGVLIGALGIFVPTGVTALAHRLGLFGQ